MVTRKRTIVSASLLAMAIIGLVSTTHGAFHDGITGSSLRQHNGVWSHQTHQRNQSRNLQAWTGSSSAKESCENAKAKEEADLAPGGGASMCTCEKSELDERYAEFFDTSDQPVVYELTCIDQRCSYCSPDGTTCDRFSYGALFEEVKIQDGAKIKDVVAQVGYFETNQYIVGRPEAITYTEYNDPSAPGAHGCSMQIDGLMCAVCEYVNCVGDKQASGRNADGAEAAAAETEIDVYFGLNVVCSNIMVGDGEGGFVPATDFETCDTEEIESIGASQGVFEMYDPDYGQCYTATEGCDRDKIELEQNGYYDCKCRDVKEAGVSPFLETFELECSKTKATGDNEVCESIKEDDIKRLYSSYVQEMSTRSIRLEGGPTINIDEFDCHTTMGFSEGCGSCAAWVDGKECDSCTMVDCGAGSEDEGFLAPSISCGNLFDDLEDDQIIDMCSTDSASETPFEAFFQCGFGENVKIPTVVPEKTDSEDLPDPVSLMACNEKKKVFEGRTDNFIDSKAMTCECIPLSADYSIDDGTLLECTTNNGECGTTNGGAVCSVSSSEDKGACFKEDLVEGFLPEGQKTPLTRTTTYTHGEALDSSLIGSNLVLVEYGNKNNGCQLQVDGQICSQCQIRKCDGSGMRPIVDCTNIVDDPSYKLKSCDAYADYEEGILLRLTARSGASDESDFQTCGKDTGIASHAESVAVDPSLPMMCEKAQPMVLPILQDNNIFKYQAEEAGQDLMQPANQSADITNPNSNFAFVSLVSSTKGLSVIENELASVKSTCGDEEDEKNAGPTPGLWYSLTGTGKGIHASVCREATDFDARISVYVGDCNSMDCVTSSPLFSSRFENSCELHWVAEEGTTYYVRVHGTSDSQTGTFGLFLETLDDDVTSTCYLDETKEFDKGCLSCAKAQANRIQQFEGDKNEIDCRCLQNPNTGGYHLTCVDLSCLKCNPSQDVCGFDTFEQEIQKTGDSKFGSYESFYFMENVEGTQASEIVSIENSDCIELEDPYQICMAAKGDMEAVGATDASELNPIFCECRATSQTGNYMLLCSIYDAFEYCADSSTSDCADVLFGQAISKYGAVTSEFRNYVVAAEGNEEEDTTITIERFSESCFVTINGKVCDSCEITDTCVNNRRDEDTLSMPASVDTELSAFTDLSINCNNIVDANDTIATFECGKAAVEDENKNILLVLEGDISLTKEAMEEGVQSNLDQTIRPDAFPPTMAPVTRPTNPPIDAPSLAMRDDENVTETPVNITSTNETEKPVTTTDSLIESSAESGTIAYLASSTVTLTSLFLLL